MIRALVFDLDGTLVQTEDLKALSYARAAIELCPRSVSEDEVLAAFRDVIGLSRRDVARSLLERFDLVERARELMGELGASTPWQAFVQVRLGIYERLLEDEELLRNKRWPHALELLEQARRSACLTALATMSHCEQVHRVLTALSLLDAFDFVATRDDVAHGKPAPEIYELVAAELDLPPGACLVVEDSAAGVEAAVAAGMHCVAVTSDLTRDAVHAAELLPRHRIVDDPLRLAGVVRDLMDELAEDGDEPPCQPEER